MSLATDATPATRVRIELDSVTFESYERQAAEAGMDIEDMLNQRLARCVDQTEYNGRTLTISPESRQRIEKAIGRSFNNGSELSGYLVKSFQLAIGKVKVELPVELLRRLETRAIRKDYKQFLQETVIRQLEHMVGLR